MHNGRCTSKKWFYVLVKKQIQPCTHPTDYSLDTQVFAINNCERMKTIYFYGSTCIPKMYYAQFTNTFFMKSV